MRPLSFFCKGFTGLLPPPFPCWCPRPFSLKIIGFLFGPPAFPLTRLLVHSGPSLFLLFGDKNRRTFFRWPNGLPPPPPLTNEFEVPGCGPLISPLIIQFTIFPLTINKRDFSPSFPLFFLFTPSSFFSSFRGRKAHFSQINAFYSPLSLLQLEKLFAGFRRKASSFP